MTILIVQSMHYPYVEVSAQCEIWTIFGALKISKNFKVLNFLSWFVFQCGIRMFSPQKLLKDSLALMRLPSARSPRSKPRPLKAIYRPPKREKKNINKNVPASFQVPKPIFDLSKSIEANFIKPMDTYFV